MNINWALRFKNKATLTALVLQAIGLVYILLGIFGVVPAVSESNAVEVALAIIDVFAMLGIVVDPTTAGIADSSIALERKKPAVNINGN